MERFAQADFIDPMFGLVAAVVVAVALTLFALRYSAAKRKAVDPLSGLFDPAKFEAEVKAIERRKPIYQKSVQQSAAILRGRIDHMEQVRALWGPEARAEAVAQVAQVVRAGVRKNDVVTDTECPEGDGSFVILTTGASEAEAGTIANRLLETLAQTRFDGIGDSIRLSASFGIAERRNGETEAEMRERADTALKAAQNSDDEQVIQASEWEEVRLLPAPAPSKPEEESSKVA